jgi:hypothetical protein
VAVQAGVCVDIFAVTSEYTDLASLKFLSIESGGSLFLYSSTDDSTLPQDLYRMLSHPYAFACILRLRTSPEFRPGHSHDHLFSQIHNMTMYNILSVVIPIPLMPMILILRTTLVLAGTQMLPLFCNLHFNIQSLYCLKKISRKDLLPA